MYIKVNFKDKVISITGHLRIPSVSHSNVNFALRLKIKSS